MKKRTVITRMDADILNKVDKAMLERLKKGLVNRKEYTRPEAFRLLGRTPEFELALEKLKKLPRKEDLS